MVKLKKSMCGICSQRAAVVQKTNEIINRAKAVNQQAYNQAFQHKPGINQQLAHKAAFQERVNQELQRRIQQPQPNKRYR